MVWCRIDLMPKLLEYQTLEYQMTCNHEQHPRALVGESVLVAHRRQLNHDRFPGAAQSHIITTISNSQEANTIMTQT